jgi:hypothetical protein
LELVRCYSPLSGIQRVSRERELRRLRKLTQARLSKNLKIGQQGVSRIEKRSDLYLSTPRSYVEGVGGELMLIAGFPDRPPVVLSGFGSEQERRRAETRPAKRPKSTAKTRRAA